MDFCWVFTNFESIIPKSYKYNLLFTLLHRAFNLCSSFEYFHQGIDKLKTILKNNDCPRRFDFCIRRYLDKVFTKNKVILKVSHKVLKCTLLFIGNSGKKLMQLRTRLVNPIESNLKFCKLCKITLLF